MLARLRARLAAQEGFTLIELITTLAILSVVLTGILVVFVAGTHAEIDMNERFHAQQEARLALAVLRHEVRDACWYDLATPANPAGTPDATPLSAITIGYCGGDQATLAKVQRTVTWCVDADGAQFALFRQSGPSCSAATAERRGERLVSNHVFGLQFDPVGPDENVRPRLVVALQVDANPANTGRTYNLDDKIMFRNWRTGVTP